MEQQGIPATAVVTEPFVPTVREIAAAHGQPDYPFVAIGHPISHNGEDELRRKADLAVAACVARLTGHPAAGDPEAAAQARGPGA